MATPKKGIDALCWSKRGHLTEDKQMQLFPYSCVQTAPMKRNRKAISRRLNLLPRYLTGCACAALFFAGQQASAETLAVPCVNGGGSGGWMYENLPSHYFPLGLITVNEWPLRSINTHPNYDPKAPWNKYGTCVIVPAKYP